MPDARRWAILTGEYPPRPGGVADYTRLVAEALTATGDEVHVWCPPLVARTDGPVHVHSLPDHFGPRSLARLDADLSRLPRPFVVLVQYVPHALGFKAMNVPLCFWLWQRRRRLDIAVMVHEPAYPFRRGQPWRHTLLAVVNRLMLALVTGAARLCFVSVPGWEPFVRRYGGRVPIRWLPIPSTVPTTADPEARRRFSVDPGGILLGHFGTFGPPIADLLTAVMEPLLAADPRRRLLLVGRRSDEFAERFRSRNTAFHDRVFGAGPLTDTDVAASLAACDLLIQPYPDGASSRRTSLMGGLALGVPTVTTDGVFTEPIWRDSGAVALAPAGDTTALAAVVERFLADADARKRLGERGRRLYAEHFSLARHVAVLRAAVGGTVK